MSAVDFHQLKKDLAKAVGYDLLYVWEDDWKNNRDKVKKALSTALSGDSNNASTVILNRVS